MINLILPILMALTEFLRWESRRAARRDDTRRINADSGMGRGNGHVDGRADEQNAG